MPGVGAPSKWVNLLVDKPVSPSSAPCPTTGANNGAVANGNYCWLAAYPTAESQGTLVDNGDGTYQYTFLRDVKQTQAIVNAVGLGAYEGSTNTKAPGGVYHIADLDPAELNVDPAANYRLGVMIIGSQPGTGTATPNAVQVTTPVPLVNTFNIGYDFRFDGATPTATRDIVEKASCSTCHDGRGIGHISTYSATNGVPPGAFVGRNDPRLCVTCHTDQAKYGFPSVIPGTNADGSPNLTTPYYRTVAEGDPGSDTYTGQAAFTYPRLVHKTHMGSQLVVTGYNLNKNCTGPALSSGGAQCLNNVGFPQDQRDCTICHDGSANAVNKTADGDNWKNVPNRLACGACHDGIDYTTGNGITLADRDADLAAGNAVGTTQSGHGGGVRTDDSACSGCHTAANIALYHERTRPRRTTRLPKPI